MSKIPLFTVYRISSLTEGEYSLTSEFSLSLVADLLSSAYDDFKSELLAMMGVEGSVEDMQIGLESDLFSAKIQALALGIGDELIRNVFLGTDWLKDGFVNGIKAVDNY